MWMSTLLITTIVLSLQPPPTPALETNEVEPRQPGSSAVQVCQASTWCGGWSRYRNCSYDWSTLQIQSPDLFSCLRQPMKVTITVHLWVSSAPGHHRPCHPVPTLYWPGLSSSRGTSNVMRHTPGRWNTLYRDTVTGGLLKDLWLHYPFWPAATGPENTKPGCCAGGTDLHTHPCSPDLSCQAVPLNLWTSLLDDLDYYYLKSIHGCNQSCLL